MNALMLLALTALTACPSSEVADIVENAESAVRATVVESSVSTDTTIPGQYLRLRVTQELWGVTVARGAEMTVWAPTSACGGVCQAPELIVGYRTPTAAQRVHLNLPDGVQLLSGSQPANAALAAGLSRLRAVRTADEILPLLEDLEPAVRRQAFRQLTTRHLLEPDARLLSHVVPLAGGEGDPELVRAYLSAFGHFRFTEASSVVTSTLLETGDEHIADSAETAFHRVARPEAVARLIAVYGNVRLPVKGRILRALARTDRPEARSLLASALGREDTFVPALNALYTARIEARRGREIIGARRLTPRSDQRPPDANQHSAQRVESNGRTP